MFTVGVISQHSLGEFFWDNSDIDLGYEEALEFRADELMNTPSERDDDYGDDYTREMAEDQAGDDLEYYDTEGTRLYGDWTKDEDDLYIPDPKGEWAAIYLPDFGDLQIVFSKYAISCNKCSPCFPGQGDIDTAGDDYMSYCLPPEELSEEFLAENKERIILISDMEK